jgi:hypothetical protein
MNKTQLNCLGFLKDYTSTSVLDRNDPRIRDKVSEGYKSCADKMEEAKATVAAHMKKHSTAGIPAALAIMDGRTQDTFGAYIFAAGAWHDLPRMLDLTGNAQEARSLRTLRVNGSTAADALERSALQKLLDHAKKMEL